MQTPRFTLEERRVAHAAELFEVLKDERLYEFLDEAPPASVDELARKLLRSESRLSPDGQQHWLNWIVRTESGAVCGYVQATVEESQDTNVAYVFSLDQQGKGIATAAVRDMLDRIASQHPVRHFFIRTEAANLSSVRLAQRLGFSLAPQASCAQRQVADHELLFWKAAPSAAG